jgi:hypothetical protein
MEHAAHLAAKEFIRTIFPSTKKKRSTRVQTTDSDDEEDSDVDDDNDGWGPNEDEDGEEGTQDTLDDDVNFNTADVLSKLLALINQVSKLFCHFMHLGAYT